MDERKRLEELRSLIGEIDREILRAIERRARVAQDMAKLRPGTSRFAPIADGTHLQALEGAVTSPFPPSAVRPIFTAIDAACRVFDVAPRVVFVGAEQSFGWIAASEHFGAGAELVRSESVAAALEDVTRSRADFAVIPYESLKDGPIFPTIQAIAGADLKIIGEREVTQVLGLMGREGELGAIEKVFSAPQDHVASVHYLASAHPSAAVVDVRSPIVALERALAEGPGAAAIVPRCCPLPDGLCVLRENIGDEGEVRVRYGVVSRLPSPRSGADATAMLFSLRERPGALHDVLQHFKERSCNLRRIQSRPLPGEGWEYIFYAEVSGHITDRPLVAALEGVKAEVKMLKILGSFPLEHPEPESVESSGLVGS